VRPTPDRVRETVFNWLAEPVRGATCLDLFAGTGVLGLESLSRGAREAVLVERDSALTAALRARIVELDARAKVVHSDVSAWLRKPPSARFDIVFVDPPYAVALGPLLADLAPWLAERARIYVERPSGRRDADELGAAAAALPHAKVVKRSRAGGVAFGLLEVAASPVARAPGEKSGLE
jgi:16S rRNA (guanine966-N2)-methyltransferase